MNIICESCQSKFTIDPGKIPAGRTATLTCPRCRNKILVTPPQSAQGRDDSYPKDEAASEEFDESPLSDNNEMTLDLDDSKKALVCEQDPELKPHIMRALESMEYSTHVSENTRDAIKRMRFHDYDLVIVNEMFDTRTPDTNGAHIYLEQLDMTRRRNMYVALISQRFRTMDTMMAFNKSVNIVINTGNISEFQKILERGMSKNELFYKVYKDFLRKAGKM